MTHVHFPISTIQPDSEGSPVEGAASENREANPLEPARMTMTARLRRGWRGATPTTSAGVPLDWRSRAWTMGGLWFLFVLAVYGVWAVLGPAN